MNYLPDVVADIEEFKVINAGMWAEIDELYAELIEVDSQFNLDTATWYLDVLERELGLNQKNLTNEQRVALIRAKIQARSTTTVKLIEELLSDFTNSRVFVDEHYNEYLVKIGIYNSPNRDLSMSAMRELIDDIKPAHLIFEYSISRRNIVSFISNRIVVDSLYPMTNELITSNICHTTKNNLGNISNWEYINSLSWNDLLNYTWEGVERSSR